MKRCLKCMEEYPDNCERCPCCGFINEAAENDGFSLQTGSILQGRYIVGVVIKERETDVFYIGWDALFERKVQIQEYFPRYCAARSVDGQVRVYDSKQEFFESAQELFIRHSLQLIRLYKEEDVITYHACFKENGTAYAIMDYRQDQTLNEYLNRGPIHIRDAQELLFKAAQAIQKVHKLGVYHGDVGLDSFWIKSADELILKDFGPVRYVSGEPGIVDYGQAGCGADVYGLAKMFCQMIIGEEIEDEEELETGLLKKVALKKTVIRAVQAALNHQTGTVEQFCLNLRGERHLVNSSRKKKNRVRFLEFPRWIKTAVIMVFVVIVGFTGLLATGMIRLKFRQGQSRMEDGMVRVHNVTGRDADDMEEELKKNGLMMSRDKMEYRKDVPENMISYQSIKEGRQVPKGTTIQVWISMGPEKAVIPPVVGRSEENAKELLEKARFTNIGIQKSYEPGIYGTVLDISREQGDYVELDQEIVLTICMNQYSGDPSIQKNVPQVTKKKEEEAKEILERDDFQVNSVYEHSDQPEGVVLSQNPETGTLANKGSHITIYISKGPEQMYMKNVQLMTQEEAVAVITEMEMIVGEVKKEYSDSIAEGKVISQGIQQDTLVAKGDVVTLVVSKGKEPVEDTKEAKKQKQMEEELARKQSEAAEWARKQSEAAEEARKQSEAAEEARIQSEAVEETQRQLEAMEEVERKSETTVELQQEYEQGMENCLEPGDVPKDPIETGSIPTKEEELSSERRNVGPGGENNGE